MKHLANRRATAGPNRPAILKQFSTATNIDYLPCGSCRYFSRSSADRLRVTRERARARISGMERHPSQGEIRAVPSVLAESTNSPSGLKAALQTWPECPRIRATVCPVLAFHTSAVLSQLADTSNWPSALKATFVTTALRPRNS